jgi:hypothetical protein
MWHFQFTFTSILIKKEKNNGELKMLHQMGEEQENKNKNKNTIFLNLKCRINMVKQL